jgi:hypothetical protein
MMQLPQRWFLWTAVFFLVLQIFFTLLFNNPTINFPLKGGFFAFSVSKILMLLAIQMAFIAIIYLTFAKMNRILHLNLGKIHFFITLFSLLLFGVGWVRSGLFNYSPSPISTEGSLFDYKLLNKFNTVAGFLLLFAQVLFVINCLNALFAQRKK